MGFREERPPQRPGVGPAGRIVPPNDDFRAEPTEDEAEQDGPEGLAECVADVIGGIERLWGEIDPRSDQADRLREYVGQCPELLAAFFSQATTFLSVLGQMLIELEQSTGPTGQDWQQPQPTPVADIAELARKARDDAADRVTAAHDKLIAKVIDILGKAGVEVDEADVYSWDEAHRQAAVEWATAERRGHEYNPYPRPDFLPEA